MAVLFDLLDPFDPLDADARSLVLKKLVMKNLGGVAMLVAVMALLGCLSAEPGPTIVDPSLVVAAEATFGDTLCRRIEEPGEVADLVEFLAQLDSGWQPFWGDPVEPQVSVALLEAEGAGTRFGLADAQFLARVDDAPAFRAATQAEANRFIELLGGVPVGQPENPCR